MTADARISIPQTLRSSGFFSTVEDGIIPRIAATAAVEHYSAGDLIFPEGAECRGIYIVARGAVRIYKIGPDGREHVIHVVEPGDIFGEAALFLGRGYPAYASAATATSLVLLRKGPFLELLAGDQSLCFKLLAAMSVWAHRLVTKIEFLTLKDASTRLAGYILERAGEEPEFMLAIPKNVLAAQLDIASETLSRLFNRFEALGLVKVRGRRISILDRDGLGELGEPA